MRTMIINLAQYIRKFDVFHKTLCELDTKMCSTNVHKCMWGIMVCLCVCIAQVHNDCTFLLLKTLVNCVIYSSLCISSN